MEPWTDEVGTITEGQGRGAERVPWPPPEGGPPLHPSAFTTPTTTHPSLLTMPPRVPCLQVAWTLRENRTRVRLASNNKIPTDGPTKPARSSSDSFSCIAGTSAALICVQRWTRDMQSPDASWRFFGAASLHERHEGDPGIGADDGGSEIFRVLL